MNADLMGLIVKREDGSEIVNYDNPPFPTYIYDGWVAPKVTWERVPHFHEDIEIVTVTKGNMAYSVNGKTIMLYEGDTIVVNSNQIHYSMSVNDEVAKYVIFIAHPNILNSSVMVEMQAIRPIIDNPELPYIRFRDINECTEEIASLVTALPDKRNDPFEVTKQFFLIWDIIRKKVEWIGKSDESSSYDPRKQHLKNMMQYIANNFQSTITLDDIAKSAGISRSLCNVIFKQYVEESPVTYLMHFRVRKVAEYLRSDSRPLSEIAEITGFGGTSYMAETFKKFYGMSPREYKKLTRENSPNITG